MMYVITHRELCTRFMRFRDLSWLANRQICHILQDHLNCVDENNLKFTSMTIKQPCKIWVNNSHEWIGNWQCNHIKTIFKLLVQGNKIITSMPNARHVIFGLRLLRENNCNDLKYQNDYVKTAKVWSKTNGVPTYPIFCQPMAFACVKRGGGNLDVAVRGPVLKRHTLHQPTKDNITWQQNFKTRKYNLGLKKLYTMYVQRRSMTSTNTTSNTSGPDDHIV